MSNTRPALTQARPRRTRALHGLSLLLACVAWASCGKESAPEGPDAATPARPELLPPELLALIERYVGLVRAAPSEGARHGELGLLYEANELWAEARASFETARSLQGSEPLWHLHGAIAQAQTGDVPTAITSLRAGAAQHPTFAPLQARLGDLCLIGGDHPAARAAYEAAQKLAPDAPEPLYGLAEIAMAEGNADQAIEELKRALAKDPHYKGAHYLLSLAYGQLGMQAEAEREFAAGKGGLKRALRDAGTLKLSMLSFGRTRARVDSSELLSARRADEAAKMLEPIVAHYPDDASLRVNLALAWKDLGRTEDALAAFAEAEALDPSLVFAPLNRAAVCLELGRAEEAAEHAARALALDPRLSPALLVRAQALVQLGRLDEARAAAEQALAVDAQLAPAYEVLGAVAEGEGRGDEARAAFQRSADLAGSDPRPWPGIFRFALRRADLELAARSVETLRKLDPGYPGLEAMTQDLEQVRGGAER